MKNKRIFCEVVVWHDGEGEYYEHLYFECENQEKAHSLAHQHLIALGYKFNTKKMTYSSPSDHRYAKLNKGEPEIFTRNTRKIVRLNEVVRYEALSCATKKNADIILVHDNAEGGFDFELHFKQANGDYIYMNSSWNSGCGIGIVKADDVVSNLNEMEHGGWTRTK